MKHIVTAIGLSLLGTGAIAETNFHLASHSIIFSIEEKRKEEINVSDLPDNVKQSISSKHEGATISKAYKWYRGDTFIGYEVVITQEDKKDEVVRFDKHGQLAKGLDN